MNTIIINKILVHMIDFEHRKVHLSKDFANINDTTQKYYRKKLEKALYSTAIKDLVVPSLHEMLLRADKMLEDEETFKEQAKEITEKLFALGSRIGEMPNCNVLYADCYQDGVHMIVVAKLNYKYQNVSVVEEDNVRITRQQVLPAMGQAVDEAILVDVDHRYVSLIEKKYLIDGKMSFYLNEQWIHGEEKLTDKQKFNTMKKVVNKLDDIYHVNEKEAYPMLKNEMVQKMINNEPVKPIALVKKVLERDYQASEESELMLKDLGVREDDVIKTLPLTKSLEKCKLVTDTDIEITMNVEDYVSGDTVEIKKEDDSVTIILKDIKEITVK